MKEPALVIRRQVAARLLVALIVLAALALRVHNVGFGLPSMHDPDEPIFMVMAYKLLNEGTLNPQWFGHPGTTTIYLLALIDVIVAGFGLLTGRYASVEAFGAAVYADPALIFVPARVAMALLGTLCVWLTYLIGRRVVGTSCGVIAAALLALNGLHIAWSQVVRTDIHASVFMLACILFAMRIAKHGRLKDYLIAGAFVGFATATKWPSVTVALAIVGAFACRIMAGGPPVRREVRLLAAAGAASLVGLFVASPYLFLDYQTVLANIDNELRPRHLGHTGLGFVGNAGYYLGLVQQTMGWFGLALVFAGAVVASLRSSAARWCLVAPTVLFFVVICVQNLLWSRWILPLLPMLCVFAGAAVAAFVELLVRRVGEARRLLLTAVAAVLAALPSAAGALAHKAERANDTRTQAARWAMRNIPPGSTVVLEHLEISLRPQPWRILFPVGAAGCIDGKQALKTGVRYEQVEEARGGNPIVDLGNVKRLETCRADYAILTYYDLYLLEAPHFPQQIRTYQQILAGGRTVALFAPRPGRAGGPVVRIVEIRQQ